MKTLWIWQLDSTDVEDIRKKIRKDSGAAKILNRNTEKSEAMARKASHSYCFWMMADVPEGFMDYNGSFEKLSDLSALLNALAERVGGEFEICCGDAIFNSLKN